MLLEVSASPHQPYEGSQPWATSHAPSTSMVLISPTRVRNRDRHGRSVPTYTGPPQAYGASPRVPTDPVAVEAEGSHLVVGDGGGAAAQVLISPTRVRNTRMIWPTPMAAESSSALRGFATSNADFRAASSALPSARRFPGGGPGRCPSATEITPRDTGTADPLPASEKASSLAYQRMTAPRPGSLPGPIGRGAGRDRTGRRHRRRGRPEHRRHGGEGGGPHRRQPARGPDRRLAVPGDHERAGTGPLLHTGGGH